MRNDVVRAVLVVLIPAAAAAQSSRDDGIRAFVAGDHTRAASILGPLAEDRQAPDSVAAFLMALLYEQGRGVGRDPFRACGLYLKAAATPGPFTEQAAELGRLKREESGPLANQFCKADARWRTPEPAAFVLGAEHTVDIMADRIVVRHRGEETRTMTGTLPDAIPLPTRYTPIDVTQPVRARRHFLHTLSWWRDTPGSWALGWMLSEVVGAQFVIVTGDRSLMSTTAAEPPANIDLGTLAAVRVSETGEAEWVITRSVNPQSAVIPWRGPK